MLGKILISIAIYVSMAAVIAGGIYLVCEVSEKIKWWWHGYRMKRPRLHEAIEEVMEIGFGVIVLAFGAGLLLIGGPWVVYQIIYGGLR